MEIEKSAVPGHRPRFGRVFENENEEETRVSVPASPTFNHFSDGAAGQNLFDIRGGIMFPVIVRK